MSLLVFNKELTDFSIDKMAEDNLQQIQEEKEITKLTIKKSLKPPPTFWDDFDLKEGINELVFEFEGNLGNKYTF